MKWMSRAALEYIARGGFGVSFKALAEDKNHEYSETIKLIRYTLVYFGGAFLIEATLLQSNKLQFDA